jgi:CheY-like chemotaxis protein
MAKILLVEDDPILLALYEQILAQSGHRIYSAKDGSSGLKMALEQDVKLVLLDVMLPELNGLEVLEKIRQDPLKKGLPVVILTNSANIAEKEKALALGASDYLVKAKQSPEEVATLVTKYLQKDDLT